MDGSLQWLADQVFKDFPSQSVFADEVWTIIHYQLAINVVEPANYDVGLDPTAVAKRDAVLARMINTFR